MLILFHDTLWGAPLDLPGPVEGIEFSTDRTLFSAADAVVFHLPEWRFKRTPTAGAGETLPEKRPRQLWVAWSMECEQHYPFMSDPNFMAAFDLTMTYRRTADVTLNYANPHGDIAAMHESFRRPPSHYKKKDALVASFISSRFDQSGRSGYLQDLAQYLAIDSYGRFMRNRVLDPDLGRMSKLKTIADYKFTIAFENACAEDYVTEKFFDPLWAGSVPVYLGAPNIEEFAPGDRCYIDASLYPDPQSLAKYLLELASDDQAYNAFFKWKTKPFRKTFEDLLTDYTTHWSQRLSKCVKEHLISRIKYDSPIEIDATGFSE
ncbi:glycosyltransferase family 10 [Labrys sp. La1]|uniref:glycosyltransferase family 10 domain-containing protein n=1 Tax=Labrys sp. La1 TaxID=3404917 RepID=UPI003EBA3193